MKKILVILLTLLIVVSTVACGSPATANTTATPASDSSTTESATEAAIASANASASPTSESTNIYYRQIGMDLVASESLGSVKIGMTESELTTAIGQPILITTPAVSAVDNKNHTDWSYDTKGLKVNLIEEDNSGYVVYSINAIAPCEFATKKGIKIGDPEESVIAEYGDAIEDNSPALQNMIIAGTISGGVIFGIEDGKVSSIFIGTPSN